MCICQYSIHYNSDRTKWLYSDVDELRLTGLPRQGLLQRVLELIWDVSADEIQRKRISVSFANEAGLGFKIHCVYYL